ncbi:MAG: glycosyltransferase family 4 protein [Candidatus Eisenbacteria bacterium]|nr:glycosyltransferase family 4 protein [Candidatus Eisenbacteria bacterium]
MARRPRLLVVGPLPPPIGGVETVTQAVLESDAFRDFEVAHCDITKGRPKATQGRFDAGNFAWAARHFARMARATLSFRPDVVYLPVAGNFSAVLRDLALGWIGRRTGARTVAHQHAGRIERVLEKRGAARAVVRAGFRQFDRLLVLGEHWRPLFEGYGVTAPIAVVPSTFRREVFERAQDFRRPDKRSGPIEGLFVGQHGRLKGTLDLLRAIAALRARGTAFRMTFVGPAQRAGDEQAVMALRRELALEDVTEFTGLLLGDALYQRFRRADLFVLPSHAEGLPVVLYEAGVFEMPAITTPVGAIPDLIRHEVNGLLVEPGNVEQLAAAIGRLVTGHDERIRLGARLRQDVLEFHPDRICGRIAENVRATLAAPAGPARTGSGSPPPAPGLPPDAGRG